MTGNEPHIQKDYQLRAKLPRYIRIAAVGAIAVTILAVVVGFYRGRSKSQFRLKSEHTQLSTDVVAKVNGYERLETDGGVTKYYIRADQAKTFSDNHQELENVFFEVYDNEGVSKDKMTAESALYIPDEGKNFTAYLKGGVQIETRDALKIRTNQITYTKKTETAEADESVEFERENVRGKSFGATVQMGEKRLELLKDVEIETFESPELSKSNVRYAKISSNSASYDQIGNLISLNENVAINIISKAKSTGAPQTTDVHADRATVTFVAEDGKSPQLKKFELFDSVRIVSVEHGASSTKIESGYALYNKDADRFELKNSVHIVTSANDKPTDVRASEASFERSAGTLALTGGAEISQGSDFLKGDVLYANLYDDNRVKDVVVRGIATIRQTTAERTTTIAAPELNAAFNQSRQLQDANAIGQSTVEFIPNQVKDYSQVTVSTTRGIGVFFKGEGLIDRMRTDGRTTIQLNATNGATNSANKRVTADTVTTFFHANGKDIRKAEAVGNAELYVEPLIANKKNYRTTINAPRFDCDFFPTGNNAKTCVAGKKAKATRVPTVATEGRGTQVINAEVLTAQFSPQSNDVESLDATGNARFTELGRNAISRQMTLTQTDEVVRLRGGEPTVWDSRARAKAREIDWDTRANRSYLRGSVGTTYYSRRQMRDSAPFGSSDKPVFITADSAEFDHTAETARYTSNARGWQDNNYVRGDMIFVDQAGGKFLAEGNVQSLLYNAKMKQKGKESIVPTYAAANSMTYDRDKRLLQYRTSVDIRQGTDRITAGSADVFLNERNELSKTIAEINVVITQPARRATGDFAQYTADDEVAILRGSPAVITEAENGSSQSGQLTFYMRDNRVISEGKSKQNTSGRSRAVYKVKPTK